MLRIALLLPRAGPIGLWGLSSENCAQMAIAEINASGGILGREVSYELVDASRPRETVAAATRRLVDDGTVEAIVGMHTSDVRVSVVEAIGGRVPVVFTPLYEGGETTPGVYMVGQTPDIQVQPMIEWLTNERGVKRWYLIGNAYNYPHAVSQFARNGIARLGGEIVADEHIPFENASFEETMRRIAERQPDGLFISLIGDSCVRFNRAFGRSKLARTISRYCTAIEENMLMAIGAGNTKNLYTSAGFYHGLGTDEAQQFGRHYHHYFGTHAPILNQFAVSCFEGVTLLSNLMEACGSVLPERLAEIEQAEVGSYGPRGWLKMQNRHLQSPCYGLEAKGIELKQVHAF